MVKAPPPAIIADFSGAPVYRAQMMRFPILICAAVLGTWATGARAQLIGEEVRGTDRICYYRGRSSIESSADGMVRHRTSIGQNCPSTPPMVNSSAPPPPTARLVQDQVANAARVCTYEQFGTSWSFTFPLARTCPPAAGMIASSRGSQSDPN